MSIRVERVKCSAMAKLTKLCNSQCSFNRTVGGKSTVTQDILLCPSTTYNFTYVDPT